MSDPVIRVVALGGTPFAQSSTENALNLAARSASASGAEVVTFGGSFLASLPNYLTVPVSECRQAIEIIDAIRRCDGLLIASPGWHGSIAGFIKNALDYLEETAKDRKPYLDGVSVGLIANAYGPQAATNTLATMRCIIHALRGWPTPLGVCVSSVPGLFVDGKCTDERISNQLEMVGKQVVEFAVARRIMAREPGGSGEQAA